MAERLLGFREGQPLPPITPGEVLLRTSNYRVVTDYMAGLEGTRDTERFFIEPTSLDGMSILLDAAKAHNTYNFTHRQIDGINASRQEILPCLHADYSVRNIPVLFQGFVKIPLPGQGTIPSLQRMEACIAKGRGAEYTFSDDHSPEYGIPNPSTRHLRLIQMTHKDSIPDRVIHSNDWDKYYKVRGAWWQGVGAAMEWGIEAGEFTDPSLIGEMKDFITKHYSLRQANHRYLTTPEDITEANALINKIWLMYGSASTEVK